MTFHVGQKVVCVRRFDCDLPHNPEIYPVEGCVYTVRAVHWSIRCQQPALLLEEIRNAPRQYSDRYCEARFLSSRFRPAVQPRKELPESITKYLNVPGRVDA